MKSVDQLERLTLSEEHEAWLGNLPDRLLPSPHEFDALWEMHPAQFAEIRIHGRVVKTPRWQQAYNRDYEFSGIISQAMPMPAQLMPFLDWTRETIDARLNGAVVNWYDGALGHYIGAHRDSRQGLVAGCPIVTISLGAERIFRLQQWHGSERVEVLVPNARVVVIPWETNLAWTHAVPPFRRYQGRRISITFRAFTDSSQPRTGASPNLNL